MPRREFPRKVLSQAKQRANGRCEKCKGDLKGSGEVDHILPDALGGEPVLANAQVLCKVCHKDKTSGDVKQVRKSDRQRDKHLGAMKKTQKPIQSAGFPKVQQRAGKIDKNAVDAAAMPRTGGIFGRIVR